MWLQNIYLQKIATIGPKVIAVLGVTKVMSMLPILKLLFVFDLFTIITFTLISMYHELVWKRIRM